MAAISFATGRRTGPEARLLSWLDSLEDEGMSWRGQSQREADRYERLFFGTRQAMSGSVPRFRANVIGPTIRRRNALLTQNKPVFKIEPLAEGLMQTADVLNELAEFAWQDHAFGSAIEEVVDLASVFGAAGAGLPYDQTAAGGLGSITLTPHDPRAVLIDPACSRAADVGSLSTKYVRIESVESIWDIQRQFPGRGMDVKPEATLSAVIKSPLSGRATGSNAGPTSYRDTIKKLQEGPIPRCARRNYFVRDPALTAESRPVFPLGRLIVRCGDVVLSDGTAPFWDGEPNLVWYENRHNFGSVWGQAEVEALRYLQGAINRIGEMFVNNTVLLGNSRVVADSDALSADAINKLNNAEALIITKKRMSQLDWVPPPPMPPHFLQFISFALRLVDYLVGLNDGQLEGRGRIEMRSGVQLEGLQNAAQILIGAMARRLEEFIERLGRKFISRIFQFYQRDRILLSTGPTGQFLTYKLETAKLYAELQTLAQRQAEDEHRPIEQVLLELKQNAGRQFAFRVQPLSSLAQTKVARAQLLMQLVEAVMMPREQVLREVGFNNAPELINKAKAEAAQMAAFMPPPQKRGGGGNKSKSRGPI